MRAVAGLLIAAAALSGAPKVQRATLQAIERSFDQRVERIDVADQFTLLGTTRGIYLDGYGAVFTAEVNLVASAVMSPFRPEFTRAEKEKLRIRKGDRVPVLKQQMRDALIQAGPVLEGVAQDEQVVLGVSIFYFKWEETTGLPVQVVMRAPRKALVQAHRGDAAALEAALKVEEY